MLWGEGGWWWICREEGGDQYSGWILVSDQTCQVLQSADSEKNSAGFKVPPPAAAAPLPADHGSNPPPRQAGAPWRSGRSGVCVPRGTSRSVTRFYADRAGAAGTRCFRSARLSGGARSSVIKV